MCLNLFNGIPYNLFLLSNYDYAIDCIKVTILAIIKNIFNYDQKNNSCV